MAGRTTTSSTPQRRTRHNNFKENLYFEPGKQGRRTGLVLEDTGVRDEHGFEPVSGIFSSPVHPSPQPQPQRDNGNDTALGSSDMVLQESPIPEVTDTLNLRKTPHLPPKTQTPRHTNIGGSPVRHSSIKPHSRDPSPVHPLSVKSTNRTSTTRRLHFTADNPDSPSPFKPLPARSVRSHKSRKSLFDLDAAPPNNPPHATDDEVQAALDHILDNESPRHSPATAGGSSSQKRRRVQPASLANSPSLTKSSKRPRPSLLHTLDQTVAERTEIEPTNVEQTEIEPTIVEQTEMEPTNVEQTGVEYTIMEQTEVDPPVVEQTEVEPTAMDQTDFATMDQTNAGDTVVETTEVEQTEVEQTEVDQTEVEQTEVEPTVIDYTTTDRTEATNAHDESVVDGTMADETDAEVAGKSFVEKHAPQSVGRNRQSHVRRLAQPQPQYEQDKIDDDDDQEDIQDAFSPGAHDFVPPPEDDVQAEDLEPVEQPEPPKKRGRGKAAAKPRNRKTQVSIAEPCPKPSRSSESVGSDGFKKAGPKSIVQLRAGTPAEEEGATTTRSGRTSVKPLKYWANESYIYNHGEIEGIVRASEVEQPRPKRAAPSRKKRGRLGPIREDEEDEEDEDLLPEEWEHEMGTIVSTVRVWDPELGAGSRTEVVDEDIASASGAIETIDVHGSSFRFAKITTLPFFGTGIVEIPPGGEKSLKNSRKMHMAFFVHEGKVTVDIEDLQFGITKGGVWQVPRGNNYAIKNESSTHTAKLFFAQGCEKLAGQPGSAL